MVGWVEVIERVLGGDRKREVNILGRVGVMGGSFLG
jgi:hypothetical protein